MASHCIKHKKINKEDFKTWWINTQPIRLYKKEEVYFQEPMANFLTIAGHVAVDELIEFSEVSSRVKELFNIELPHENAGKREQDYRWYYDENMYDLITEKYQEDLATFNYKF